jgi:hypothetical protein
MPQKKVERKNIFSDLVPLMGRRRGGGLQAFNLVERTPGLI